MKNCGPDFPRYVGVPELMRLMKKLINTVHFVFFKNSFCLFSCFLINYSFLEMETSKENIFIDEQLQELGW
jgi:hypothetical protein